MITGIVNEYNEATLRLLVKGNAGQLHEVEAVIDTGFTEFLSLPVALIETLGLVQIRTEDMMQSDGSIVTFRIYAGTVVWDGKNKDIEIQVGEASPILGLALIQDYCLIFPVRSGSTLTLTLIP